MGINLSPVQIEKRRAQAQAMQERARAKQKAKQDDPEWRREQMEKQQARNERYMQRSRDKAREIFRTATIAQQDAIDDYSNETNPHQTAMASPANMAMAAINPKPPAKYRNTATRGLKGRTPLAAERTLADKLATLPCIACYFHGQYSPVISLHHMHGRTVLGAHEKQLPLCTWHHQELAPPHIRLLHIWLIPFHAAGKHGGKSEWERLNAPQEDLYEKCLELLREGVILTD